MHFELKKADWARFFDNLSKRRFEWATEIEVIGDNVGDQTLSNGLPLNGITVETVGDRTSIDISVGEATGHHQTHMVVDPKRVAFLAGDDVHGDIVDIEEADGTKTLIRLIEPMGLLVGFAAYEKEVAAA
jgi:hypothetical protein